MNEIGFYADQPFSVRIIVAWNSNGMLRRIECKTGAARRPLDVFPWEWLGQSVVGAG